MPFTKDEILAAVRKVSKEMASRMETAYNESCEQYWEAYTNGLPDEEDFYSWLEDYDWVPSE